MGQERSTHDVSSAGRRRCFRLAWILGLPLLLTWTLGGQLQSREVERGELEVGYFEDVRGRWALALSPEMPHDLWPTLALDRLDRVAIPPGMTAAVPLDEGASLQFEADGPMPLPYVVLGRRAADSVKMLSNPLMMSADATAATWTPWVLDAPWSADAQRLARLADRCGLAGAGRHMRAQRSGAQVTLTIGRCVTHWSAGPPARRDTILVALVAGPGWGFIERSDRPWRAARSWRAMAALLAGAIAVTAGLDVLLRRRRHAGRALLALSLGACLATAAAVWFTRPSAEPSPRYDLNSARNRCLVLGYSTVAGVGLRSDVDRVDRVLGKDSTVCAHQVGQVARSGATLPTIAHLLQATRSALQQGARVVFIGGTNDDLMYSRHCSGAVPSLPAVRVLYHLLTQQPGTPHWTRTIDQAAQASDSCFERQRQQLQDAVRTVRGAGASFLYVHDMLVTDLPDGRSALRQGMLDRRRDAVQQQGGTFVDLQQQFAGRAGVAWFSDFVHLSAIGHRQMAQLIERSLRQTAPP